MKLTTAEESMWGTRTPETNTPLTDEDINAKYVSGEQRIVTESNREKLPSFANSLKDKNLIDLAPFYQRRKRWDRERQSKLIESFIINVPVPPVFLYEKDYGQYEVMDGQQRITAIKEFYDNEFALEGLEQWPELNGRRYHDLPAKVKAGIDRRSISSIVLLKESAQTNDDEEAAVFVRQTVFERLNTGGVKLEAQEIRNALYPSKFNEMLEICSRNQHFRSSWGLPQYTEREERGTSAIHNIDMYKKMEDIELVLRFFALRHTDKYRFGMKGFLSLYMQKASQFNDQTNRELKKFFETTIHAAVEIYGTHVFKYYDHLKNKWIPTPRKTIYDGVMIALWNNIDRIDQLIADKQRILESTISLFSTSKGGEFTGRANSKKDIEQRIQAFTDLYGSI